MAKPIAPEPEQSAAEAKQARRVVILTDRRIQNPFGVPSEAITADKIWRAKNLGWEPVTPDMLVDRDQVGGFTTSPDGYVTRGDRHAEVLMYMPTADREAIQMAKTRQNLREMNQKAPVIDAAAQQFGDQAGAFLEKAAVVGQVRDNYERIASDPRTDE